jgi:hypothetical protein
MGVEKHSTVMTRFMSACVNAALVVTSVIVGTLFCELGLRMVGYTSPIKSPYAGMAPRFYYVADSVNGHDIAKDFAGGPFIFPEYIRAYGAPYTVSSNRLGCRDRSFDQQNGYVLLLGDSYTWGYVPLEETWGAILEQLVGIRVLKCGVGGYGTRHERHKLEAVVAKAGRPRLVVVGYVGNDLIDDYLYPERTVIDGYMVPRFALADEKRGDRKEYSDEELQARLRSVLEQRPDGFTAAVKDVLANHSILYDRFRHSETFRRVADQLGLAEPAPSLVGLGVYRYITEYPWLKQAWQEHLANLRQLKSAVEAVGASMLVVMIPNVAQVYEFLQDPDEHWREYRHNQLTQFFEREDIAFLDLLPEFQRYACRKLRPGLDAKEDLYWPRDGHLNVKGNRLAGFLISRVVLEQPFLELNDKNKRLLDINQVLNVEDRCGVSRATNDRKLLR